ncbi:glycolate oxidase subunit GlcF [Ramlibacter sp. 2FC]|uniref:glycolate oxidase subunit GlcF n=1 Tax=Ramlibacter sp. 2FC TaxID=2502188 RepID=UPI0010F83AD7|nr:glycolate oxidase subunit GlcF [Ramlibacter sp. 2FC]
MRIELEDSLQGQVDAADASRIIQSCVHCGLCTAACPTYELLDHELDSPRGRIYLIREMLQGAPASATTREHLDRCLSCRACEPACPSGVEYGHLIDIGRQEIERRAPRPAAQRWLRSLLRRSLSNERLVRMALGLAWRVRPVLPARLKARVPPRPSHSAWPRARHARRVLTLRGCVQPTLAPGYDAALARLLDRFGISLVGIEGTGCCGALSQHLGGADQTANAMRRNIDAWWPLLDQGAEAIVASSSGCGAMLKDYGHLLQHDPAYAAKARRISAMLRDPAQLLVDLWESQPLTLQPVSPGEERLAYHAPCTQQHGLRIQGPVEALLKRAGYQLAPVAEPHMCCGSAGTFSILQPELAGRLRERKLGHLTAGLPMRIASANIGCILHLQQTSPVAVHHWLELLEARLPVDSGEAA